MIALREAECCALAGTDCRPLPLRRRAGRPQLKRDPLGADKVLFMIRISTCLLLGLVAAVSDTAEPPVRWAWFRSTSVINDWFITRGRADVTIEGETFKATLWDADDSSFARISLEGSIVRNSVTVTVTVNESDVGPSRASGRLQKTCWKQGGGREAIILNEGFAVIGLVRELPTTTRCHAGA